MEIKLESIDFSRWFKKDSRSSWLQTLDNQLIYYSPYIRYTLYYIVYLQTLLAVYYLNTLNESLHTHTCSVQCFRLDWDLNWTLMNPVLSLSHLMSRLEKMMLRNIMWAPKWSRLYQIVDQKQPLKATNCAWIRLFRWESRFGQCILLGSISNAFVVLCIQYSTCTTITVHLDWWHQLMFISTEVHVLLRLGWGKFGVWQVQGVQEEHLHEKQRVGTEAAVHC